MATWLILANKGISSSDTCVSNDILSAGGAGCQERVKRAGRNACICISASLRWRHLEHERRDAADGLVEHQRARERRLGALAAIHPLAQPAIDADRGRLRLVEINPGCIDES